MLSLIRRVFCPRCFPWGTGTPCEDCDTRTPVERWAERNAKVCSPEQLVEAHVINAIAKDLDDWKLVKEDSFGWPSYVDFEKKFNTVKRHSVDRMLVNRQKHKNVKGITIFYEVGNGSGRAHREFNVNNVPFAAREGIAIIAAFDKLTALKKEADRVAARALEEQKRNEQRWNLAEELLGLRRNEHGALVPVKTVEA
jgi:hypothetical protein